MLLQDRSGKNSCARRFQQAVALGIALATGGLLSATLVPAHALHVKKTSATTPRDIADFASPIEDMEVRVHVTRMDPKEMEKIGKDFGLTYRIPKLTVQYKQPDKMRLAGNVRLLGEALLIMNGSTRYYSVPRLGKKTEDLEKFPARRLSLLEYSGLLSPGTLRFMQGRFVREEQLDGHHTLVFDMNYVGGLSATHYRLWIDPETHITSKREWFDSENRLRATFYYLDPQEVAPKVWLPSRVEVKNADGVLAASTTLNDARINQGLPDALFAIKP